MIGDWKKINKIALLVTPTFGIVIGGANILIPLLMDDDPTYEDYDFRPFYVCLKRKIESNEQLTVTMNCIYYDLSGNIQKEETRSVGYDFSSCGELFFGKAPLWAKGVSFDIVVNGILWSKTYEASIRPYECYFIDYSFEGSSMKTDYIKSGWGHWSGTCAEFSHCFIEKYDSNVCDELFGRDAYQNLKQSFFNYLDDPERLFLVRVSETETAADRWARMREDYETRVCK